MSQAIIEYGIAGSETAYDLTQRVNQAIDDGWEPFGGVGIGAISVEIMNIEGVAEEVTQHYFQALVKRETLIKTGRLQ